MPRQCRLVDLAPTIVDDLQLIPGLGHPSEAVRGSLGQLVRRMGVEVIEKHEEGTPRLGPSGKPLEKSAID